MWSYFISLNIKPLAPTFLTSIMSLKLLHGCCNFPSSLRLNLGSLSGLFLCGYCWTKVHTLISRRVNLHTHLEILVEYISCLSNYWRWLSSNEIGYCCFTSFLLANFSTAVNIVSVFLTCFSFLMFSFIWCSTASLCVAFCRIIIKYSSKVTTWLWE